MPVAAAIAGAAVIGAGASIYSGNKAAKAQQSAADQQVGEYAREYDTTRSDFAPWRATGAAALGKLSDIYGLSVPTGAGTTGAPGTTGGQTVDMFHDGIPGNARAAQAAGMPTSYTTPPGTSDVFAANTGGTEPYGGFFTSPGYQFRVDQGNQAIQRSAAARGLLGSGATLKAIDRFTQDTASSEFDKFTSGLMQLSGFGQSAANSTAAAGQNKAQGMAGAYGAAGDARASSYLTTGSAINSGMQNAVNMYMRSQGGGFGSGGSIY